MSQSKNEPLIYFEFRHAILRPGLPNYAHPSLLLPGEAGRKNLARMHEAVAKEIRKNDDRHLIFYEPVTRVRPCVQV